ncbi:MAG: hypothetical protein WC284_08505 [Candidimonas sp.]
MEKKSTEKTSTCFYVNKHDLSEVRLKPDGPIYKVFIDEKTSAYYVIVDDERIYLIYA